MHIGIFGLAGAGKTTLTSLLTKRNPSYKAISASKMIAMKGGVIKHESLDHQNIRTNQSALVTAYTTFKTRNPCTLIELHCLIETQEGVEEIDPAILVALELEAVFFILVPPSELLRRREMDKTKLRRLTSFSELTDLQNRSLDILRRTFAESIIVISPENSLYTVEKTITRGKSMS